MAKKLVYVIQNKSYGKSLMSFEIEFKGFTDIPKEFKANGQGFPNGKPILEILQSKFKKYKLTITSTKKSNVSKKGNIYLVFLNITDLKALSKLFFENRKPFNHKIVLSHFSKLYSKYFDEEIILTTYQKGIFTKLLATMHPSQLSKDDQQSIINYLPKLSSVGVDLSAIKKQKVDYQLIYLEKTLNDLEKKLNSKAKEPFWQTYIRENIIFLHESYIKKIEHLNVSIDIKLPDFCLLNYENYLDVLEIKTPETKLLIKDSNHNNYYWSSAISQAISQTENYIDSITKYSDKIANKLRDENIDVRVIKPRGLILAGHSSQLNNKLMKDNFRLLNEALRNVQIITYDDLITRAKNIIFSIKEIGNKRQRKGKKK